MRIGIDLGGTKIELAAIDEDGRERCRTRVSTPAAEYGAIVDTIRRLVLEAEAGLGVSGCTVGVGTPGAISPATGLVKNSNTTCLIGKPLDRDLSRALDRPVRIANDANCFALSEATDGAAAGADVVFGVIIGTGTGGGIVAHGKLLGGPNAIAGEWGHNPLPWPLDSERPGPRCYCGKLGCIETFISGTGLARDYELVTGTKLSGEKVAGLAHSGEPSSVAALERYEDRLARSLASIINVVDPDVIVLGGGVSNVARLYDNVPALLRKYVFSDTLDTKLVKARHGDSSGVRGAAWLWGDAR
ncbi:MAG: ROK family protein [Deltaproteobacteria bacterium]|nr:ROK family protein [Deltaproteobacteria bacterium]